MIKKKAKLNPIEKKYCRCLVKVRGKSLKKKKITSPYGICTKSVYTTKDLKRTKRINCLANLDLKSLTFKQLKAIVIEKKLKPKDMRKKLEIIKSLKKYLNKKK